MSLVGAQEHVRMTRRKEEEERDEEEFQDAVELGEDAHTANERVNTEEENEADDEEEFTDAKEELEEEIRGIKRKRETLDEPRVTKKRKLDLETPAPIELPDDIKKRRKLMAMRNPFRNLLKRTLSRNLLRKQGSRAVAAALNNAKCEHFSSKSNSSCTRSHSHKHKSSSHTNKSSSHTHKSSSHKSKAASAGPKTPPRNPNLSDARLFTPPNLTPPVHRRPLFRVSKSQRTINFNKPGNES